MGGVQKRRTLIVSKLESFYVSVLTKRYVPLLLHVYTRFFFTFSFCARVFTITLGHSTRLYTI